MNDPTLKYKSFTEAYEDPKCKLTQDGVSFKEAVDFFAYRSLGNGVMDNLFASDQRLWQGIGGNGGPTIFITYYIWLSTTWFNRWQRFAGRISYLSAQPASSAVNTLQHLVMRKGFEYGSEKKSANKIIKDFVKLNKWKEKSKEAFLNYIVDGEVYIRMFKGEKNKVRFIDPDLIYSLQGAAVNNNYLGVLYDPNDYEDITGYETHTVPYGSQGNDTREVIPSDEVQPRANRKFGLMRGMTKLLSVFPDIFNADQLTTTLGKTMCIQAAIAFIRQHDATKDAIMQMRNDIQAQPQNSYNNNLTTGIPQTMNTPMNVEHYPAGSWLDTNDGTKIEVPQIYNSDSFVQTVDMILRKIASEFSIPVGIYSNDKSERGAFASELVHNSYITIALEAQQQKWEEWDRELIADCCNLDPDDVNVNVPNIATVDKKAQVEEAMFLLNAGLISKETLSKRYELDFEEEQEKIKAEQLNKGDGDEDESQNTQRDILHGIEPVGGQHPSPGETGGDEE